MLNLIRYILHEQCIKESDNHEPLLLENHRNVLLHKPLLKEAYLYFYQEMVNICDKMFKIDGLELEIGSGVGFFKDVRKNVLTTDIRNSEHIDMDINALSMPFIDNSIKCIYAINVFHHLSEIESFFDEISRVLKVGGGCILVEPHIGFTSRLIHKYLHSNETFLPDELDWSNKNVTSPLNGANQAMSYIVFERDYAKFEKIYGSSLQIVHKQYAINSLKYLFSGGLNYKQLIPNIMTPVLSIIERILAAYAAHWSLHKFYVLKKI